MGVVTVVFTPSRHVSNATTPHQSPFSSACYSSELASCPALFQLTLGLRLRLHYTAVQMCLQTLEYSFTFEYNDPVSIRSLSPGRFEFSMMLLLLQHQVLLVTCWSRRVMLC